MSSDSDDHEDSSSDYEEDEDTWNVENFDDGLSDHEDDDELIPSANGTRFTMTKRTHRRIRKDLESVVTNLQNLSDAWIGDNFPRPAAIVQQRREDIPPPQVAPQVEPDMARFFHTYFAGQKAVTKNEQSTVLKVVQGDSCISTSSDERVVRSAGRCT